MKTAHDFARVAIALGQIADEIRTSDSPEEIFPQARLIAVFHLRSAARGLRDAAEALAKLESARP